MKSKFRPATLTSTPSPAAHGSFRGPAASPLRPAVLALVSLGLFHCTGSVDGTAAGGMAPPGGSDDDPYAPPVENPVTNPPPSMGPGPLEAAGFRPAPAALRKLTVNQYQNSLQDIFGEGLELPTDLEADTVLNGYTAIANAVGSVSATGAEKFEEAAFDVAGQVVSEPMRSRIVTCTPAATVDAACTRQVLGAVGERAFRRALTEPELTRFASLSEQAATNLNDFYAGLEFGIAAILQSVPFLYRVELGEPDPAEPGLLRFTSQEMASRLSYLIWNTTPDQQLLAAGAGGSLVTDAGLAAEATRLLASPRAREGIAAYHAERFTLSELDNLIKDSEVYPDASPTLAQAMKQEVVELVNHIVFEQGGDYRDLIAGGVTYVNEELGDVYGLNASGSGFSMVNLPETSGRIGFLTSGAFLAQYAHPDETSPTRRGKFIREVILCESIPLPPPGADTVLPEPNPDLPTMRDRLAEHATDPTCASCHAAMDPIGLAFENFDGIGAYREEENDTEIDPSGDFDGVPFANARELSQLIAASPGAARCAVKNLYRYAVGRVDTTGDAMAIDALDQAFTASGYRFDELVKALVTSPGLRYVGKEG